MSKFASFIKSLRLKQIAIVFFAGAMLLFNTACSNSAQAKVPPTDGGPNPVGQTQPYEGGMNNFSDTPPGQIPSEKARSLVDNAERNITSDDPTKAEPRNAKLYKNPGYAADRTKDTIGDAITSRANNAKEEVQKVGQRVSNSGERAVEKTKELGGKIGKGAENVTDNVTNSAVGAGEATKSQTKSATKAAKQAAKDAID
ncbi:DUF6658 family protein [Leptolyngbya sp. NIES-2104]|uniref:DUF6658 family protein n=1 Tax=Leptolyngbya sp. NIES-2104 TaxID=1552121 RepID=UPI0006EC838B|nr:DUF6658 family protein [Leptolyngbya sp. NIES-2104]GAP99229.1 hypothetical protein NIES2104_57900 [Leptolyngbya sp. NIES-2104]